MLATLATPHPDPGHAVDRTASHLWYTLCVIPHAQARVCQRARELGIETYAPMSRTPPQLRKFGRQRVTEAEVRPLMPGYVFVSLSACDPRFYLFQATAEPQEGIRGALRLLGSHEGPMPVHEAVIADMRLRERNGEFDLTGLSEDGKYYIPKWAKRSTVVGFLDGPFKGFLGTVVKAISYRLIEVEVEIFGRISTVTTPLDWIRRVEVHA